MNYRHNLLSLLLVIIPVAIAPAPALAADAATAIAQGAMTCASAPSVQIPSMKSW